MVVKHKVRTILSLSYAITIDEVDASGNRLEIHGFMKVFGTALNHNLGDSLTD